MKFKVGDKVANPHYNLKGIVQEIGPCRRDGCEKSTFTFTLDPPESKVRIYFHLDSFNLVEEN